VKVYLASQYARRDELCEHRAVLEPLGIEVTSRWLDEQEPLTGHMGDKPDAWYVHTANVDLEDVDRADAVIFFSENPRVGIPRGGRHVEFGYALGTKKPIYVVGPKENVFHYIEHVYHFETLAQFIEMFKMYIEVQNRLEVL
jgi:nucleoside 2-deoxyribosyltransferase